jgi:hypothetical protein
METISNNLLFYDIDPFSLFSKVSWQFLMFANYLQQALPHLGFYSSSIKGWITQDITLEQEINIKPFLVTHAL